MLGQGERARGRRLSYANVTATLALVLAMSGGALAATHYIITSTKQIKPSVLSQLKGTSGAPGSPGAQGPQGTQGSQGPAGNPGNNGSSGATGPSGGTGARGATGASGATGATGASGATGATGIGLDGIFGLGGDGVCALTGTTNNDFSSRLGTTYYLEQDVYCSSLTLSPGVTLNTAGYRVFVQGTLTLDSGSAIENDGHAGTASLGGAALDAESLGASGAGGGTGPSYTLGTCPTPDLGGVGGFNAIGSGGVTLGVGPSLSAGGYEVLESTPTAITDRDLDGNVIAGGCGGTGAAGGGGGGGGGVVVIVARVVTVSGDATISANGGDGYAASATDAGGGGGGGLVIVVSTTTAAPAGLTVETNGGTATGPGSPGAGIDGGVGTVEWLS